MDEIISLNNFFARHSAFMERFSAGPYLAQPHVMHISRPQADKVGLHQHHALEYSLIVAGNMRYIIGGANVEARAGDAVFIPPHTPHRWEKKGADTVVFGFMFYVFSQGDNSRKNLRSLRKNIEDHCFHISNFTPLREITQKIISLHLKPPPCVTETLRTLAQLAFIELMNNIVTEPVSSRTGAVHPRGDNPENVVDKLMFYIQDNVSAAVSAADAATYMGLSVNHLNRILKKHGYPSLNQVIWGDKLSAAQELLKNSDRHVKDIAMSVGFDDVDYFLRRFRKSTGETPSLFRLRIRG
jgi:AraC-like DNA-binding protein